jgi:hypothetical protein
MDHFEWRTDEDGAREAFEQPAPERRRAPRRAMLAILMLLTAGALVIAGHRLYRAAQVQIADATARVEADVRASHDLVRQAGERADLELFTRFLSSADPEWAMAQEQLVSGESWLDRSALDLSWQQTVSATAAITLSADLSEAEVVSQEVYTFTNAGGEQERASLAHTRVYRLGPDRWLFAPPHAAFWGEVFTTELPRLRLAYPARDEALAQRLAADLSELIERACNELEGLDCPVHFRLATYFTRNPAILQTGQLGSLPLWAQEPLVLPAPSLVGLPLDEAAYHALYLGYARHVTAATIGQLVDWRCCRQGLFYQVLLEEQWQALNLAPAPLRPPASAYRHMLQGQLDVGNATSLWVQAPAMGESPALQSTRAIFAFLRQRFSQRPIAAWQRALSQSEQYAQWVAAVTGERPGPALAMGWHSYLYERAGSEEPASTPPAPVEDLLLLCEVQGAGRRVMRFDPQTETFSPEIESAPLDVGDTLPRLAPAPPGGVFFAGYQDGALQIWRWQNGEQQLIWESEPEGDLHYRFEGASPDGHFIAVEVSGDRNVQPAYHIAGVTACLENGCEWSQSVYRPTWSPDDRFVVNTTPRGDLLFLGRTDLQEQSFWTMDMGADPVWLDVDTFAFVRRRAGELDAVVLMSVGIRQVQNLVGVDDLRAQLPRGGIVAPTIGLVRHPLDDNIHFVALQTVHAAQPASTHVFLVRRDTGQLFNLFSVADADPRSLSISPAGRWLALVTAEGLMLYDLVMDRGGVYAEGAQSFTPQWSPDGNWLFSGSEGRYTLIAPGKEVREVRAEAYICDAAIWLHSD